MASARIDASQVERFADRLALASRQIDEEADRFEEKWGDRLVDELRSTVAVDTGTLRDSIDQGEPGEISMEGYAQFLERGTAHMSPQPFIRPAFKRIEKPAAKDAGERAVKLIQRGR